MNGVYFLYLAGFPHTACHKYSYIVVSDIQTDQWEKSRLKRPVEI